MLDLLTQNIKDKHIVIVGGSSGMGKASAHLLEKLGANITIASRSKAKLNVAAQGTNFNISELDTTHETKVKQWAKSLGQVDHLVISASSVAHGGFSSLATDDVRSMLEAKFIGPYVTAREVLPFLNQNASITFFSGVLSRRASVGAVALGAVNAAVEAFTKGLALELSGKARVNCISPGMVNTEAYAQMPENEREQMFEGIGQNLPVGRVGHANEIALAVASVIANDFMTGSVIDVDGGHLARS